MQNDNRRFLFILIANNKIETQERRTKTAQEKQNKEKRSS